MKILATTYSLDLKARRNVKNFRPCKRTELDKNFHLKNFLNEHMAQTIILQQYKWRNSLPDSCGLKTKKTQEIHKKEKRFVTYNAQSNSSRLGRPRKLTTFQEFVLVLMKLRLDLFNRDLAHRFGVSLTSVSVIFRTWIWFLRAELECLIRLPPREVLQLHMPALFK